MSLIPNYRKYKYPQANDGSQCYGSMGSSRSHGKGLEHRDTSTYKDKEAHTDYEKFMNREKDRLENDRNDFTRVSDEKLIDSKPIFSHVTHKIRYSDEAVASNYHETDRIRANYSYERRKMDQPSTLQEGRSIVHQAIHKSEYNDYEKDNILAKKDYDTKKFELRNALPRELYREKTLEIKQLQEDCEKKNNTITEFHTLLDETLERNKKLNIENTELKNIVQQLKTFEEKYVNGRKLRNELRKEKEYQALEIIQLKNEINDLLKPLEERYENARKLNKELQKEKDYQAIEIIQLKSEVDNLVKSNVNEELKVEVDKLKVEKEEFIQQIANLELNLQKKQEALHKILEKYKTVKVENCELEKSNLYKHQYSAQKNEFESLKQQFDQLTVVSKDKDIQLGILKKENEELVDEIKNMKLLRYTNKPIKQSSETPETVNEQVIPIDRNSNKKVINSDIFPTWWKGHMSPASLETERMRICPNCLDSIDDSAMLRHIEMCMTTDDV